MPTDPLLLPRDRDKASVDVVWQLLIYAGSYLTEYDQYYHPHGQFWQRAKHTQSLKCHPAHLAWLARQQVGKTADYQVRISLTEVRQVLQLARLVPGWEEHSPPFVLIRSVWCIDPTKHELTWLNEQQILPFPE